MVKCVCNISCQNAGHAVNLTNIMSVLKEVNDMRTFSKRAKIPDELTADDCTDVDEEFVGKISSYLLKMNMPWHQLKDVLVECDEWKSAGLAELMEQYICKGIPQISNHLPLHISFYHITTYI